MAAIDLGCLEATVKVRVGGPHEKKGMVDV
jgi:hypothetical protein